MALHKDEILNSLAATANVAQFVAFRPVGGRLVQSYCRIAGFEENHRFQHPKQAVEALLGRSSDRMVNVRSYEPNSPRSREFVYGLRTVDETLAVLDRLAAEDLHLIVNETIDIHDGGVSGVVQGQLIEFAPDDTPRCVEKPGAASLPLAIGMNILGTVYGFSPEISFAQGSRIEFSIHPKPRGYHQRHTIVWELERDAPSFLPAALTWPNRFSRHLGDKVFGLLVANALGVPVPRTTVIGRRTAPFTFGRETGSSEVWTRTAPNEPQPGLYTTVKGWLDPFALLSSEDPDGSNIRSVICQSAVRAEFSGAAVTGPTGEIIIEGRRGEGDQFMLGLQLPETLPPFVLENVSAIYAVLASRLGPVRFEWVHDGDVVWIVQLHCGGTGTTADVIVPGEAETWAEFESSAGLDKLRGMLASLPRGQGILVVGRVGLTSHVADLLRKANRPSKLKGA
ncbi:hypothetical protein CN128_25890 [Sinorhizobium meliloti]|uniref:hypothetical protein n=1 Tax=Rhizobium meliloti TaxID=382 RepID=UPI0001E4A57D|nr:hypothetical protein [Sinorhizobium meliloti]AEG06558.1 hypothetical protein SinmeB_5291 [Sinorhizobium meliloti BL225C]MDE4547018.1 hypothetical protein [Sinorhizobium meliloti]MDE4570657.1 hypothetical protein [Sinorhizobium meliloti]MDX0109020.1 hypothetical protein [Sinorhizobium meliloti]MDX0315132.1 hypothetical protein [Sinorhizobium meliloti]